jgi:ribosomal protein S18 acetylase RimI-like enzyme
MHFELDDILIDDILFHMENQDGVFFLDTQKGQVIEGIDVNNEHLIALPEWTPADGYRLMEKFAAGLKNPVIRQELSAALNRNKGVFRAFRDVLEQYPETEKMWFSFKEKKMKNEVIVWYNSLREEWGLEPAGIEPEDNSSLVLEDFVLREASSADAEIAAVLHKICIEERQDKASSDIIEAANPFVFPGDLCIAAENADGEFSGYIYAVKDSPSSLRICALEIFPEYRGMGLGKTLLSKLIEKSAGQTITIDLPAGMEYFSRTLHHEGFKPSLQKFIRN